MVTAEELLQRNEPLKDKYFNYKLHNYSERVYALSEPVSDKNTGIKFLPIRTSKGNILNMPTTCFKQLELIIDDKTS